MLKVGLTGGIGSGKSTVAGIFETLGIPVYYADDAAKSLMNSDAQLREAIIQLFGEKAYENDELNRAYLAERVFHSPKELEKLNTVVHPATLADAARWMERQESAYAIKEAALIFESGSQEHLDVVIGVYAPATLRLHRVMQRDNISREAVLARMSKQIDEEIKMRLCDFVVRNDEQELLIPQVLSVHEQLLSMAGKRSPQ